ncbi:hypothetical protein EF096_01640 [Pseudomonas neustonica]|uniref:Mechanosensitive ion channel family protein n=1 Tax=Pseudomonas neustonica TaxID=2487346 RepID=A0ABX9XMZ3_9PSED|nr:MULTISPECIES: hypothetical protein [Pseudomonas]ROZ86966.1 hypothetical protein EF099_01060 [Pseudomonas sp. SSM44]ROZ88418.1 hypothetical protein EF096_01640 [Pseudomonas neustonica]
MHSYVGRQRSFWFRTLLLILAAAVVLLSWLGSADRSSVDYVDSALLQASVAFASARALNALISVLQSTTLSFSLFGGVAVTLGELLDPFNDLIEQYGTLMQWAIGSLLTQKILLGVVSHSVFKVLITLSAILLAFSLWWRRGRWAASSLRLFLALLFLRFAMAAVVLLNGVVDHYFLDDQTRQQVVQLDNLPAQVKTLGGNATVLDTEPALNALRERERPLQQQRNQLLAEQERLGHALAQSRRALTELEQQLGGMARLNPFSRSEDHIALLRQVERLEDQQQAVEDQFRPLVQRLADIGQERAAVQEAKADGATDAIPLGEQFARAADPETYLAIKQALDSAVDTVLRAMTLFVLRTLILPLLFLYLLIKGLRAIWRIDWRPWLAGTYSARRVIE